MSRFKTSSSLTLEPRPLNTIPYLSPTKTKGKDMGNETLHTIKLHTIKIKTFLFYFLLDLYVIS